MKRTLDTIKNVFVWLVMVLAIAMMLFTILSVNVFNRSDRSIFGYRLYVVYSDSMSATDFDAGSLIFVKEVDPSTLEEGDIITYMSQNSANFGETVTHKIRKRTVDAQGNPGFVTYGTTTDTDDETVVTYPYILGKYEKSIPHIGTFFNFLKTPQGYIVCIFVPFMLLILYEGINCIRLFNRYKKEQMEEVNAEKEKLQAERDASAKMMAELQALKQQLERQHLAGDAPQGAKSETTVTEDVQGTESKDEQ